MHLSQSEQDEIHFIHNDTICDRSEPKSECPSPGVKLRYVVLWHRSSDITEMLLD